MHPTGLGDFEIPVIEPREPGRWATWPPAAQWTAGCGAGCALLVVLAGLAFWGMMAAALTLRPPAGLTAAVQAPARVTVGTKFPLKLVYRNTSGKTVTVTNVAVSSRTLRALSIDNP